MSRQHKPEQTATQSVVELLRATQRGLIFWSRQRIEITAELQLRMHRDVLRDSGLLAGKEWVWVKGFVVECKPSRRSDGSVGFEVSIVFDPSTSKKLPKQTTASKLRRVFGMN